VLYASIFELVPWELPSYSWAWVLLGLLINDFLFYWYHRLSHTTRFFWALHVAHHSSEKMNITTAIRGNFVNNLFHAIFWIPMLLMGFPPIIVIMSDSFSYFYQLWLHTRIIPKLGPLEYVLNTPSHHRVHHGSNPQYIDKNYGAVFIFWDKLFGTFEEEDEPVRYGLTKPFDARNPLTVAFYEFGAVFRAVASRRGLSAKVQELFRRPYDVTALPPEKTIQQDDLSVQEGAELLGS
jgi:sterol desaturase/sphingolipid hydroxylase (fatty acid hydroxylase superfamily)